MPIFRVKSVKIYTGQKKFTRVYPWDPWQIRGMTRRKLNEGYIHHDIKIMLKIGELNMCVKILRAMSKFLMSLCVSKCFNTSSSMSPIVGAGSRHRQHWRRDFQSRQRSLWVHKCLSHQVSNITRILTTIFYSHEFDNQAVCQPTMGIPTSRWQRPRLAFPTSEGFRFCKRWCSVSKLLYSEHSPGASG